MRPVSDEFPVSQEFGSDATAGVTGDPNGTEVQQLVAAYGNYQPYGHAGQDIACPIGTPVHAIADGTVIWADWGSNLPGDDTDAGYRQRWYMYKYFPGIVTLIQHDGWISMYGHLSSNDAAPVGTQVTEGQLIGLSGNTKAPGVTLGAHLHVGALVDLTYSCSNGYIYGCVDPTPYYGTISAQSATITPEGFLMALTDDEQRRLLAAADRINYVLDRPTAKVLTDADLTTIADAVLGREVPWYGFDGNQPASGRTTTTLAITTGYSDTTAAGIHGAIGNVPANVLNQSFKLPDGTVTNLAGILTAIHATPVAAPVVTNNVSPTVDPAVIAAAVLDAIKTQVNK